MRFNKPTGTTLDTAGIYLLAGDHGITEERVSAYVPEMTAKMVIQFVSGGGAINAITEKQSDPQSR